jgi:hypothetical protein
MRMQTRVKHTTFLVQLADEMRMVKDQVRVVNNYVERLS